MNYPRLIALYSPAPGSGKSTVAQHLMENHGYVHVSFAQTLKTMAAVFLDVFLQNPKRVYAHVYGPDVAKSAIIPELGVSARHVMQTLGTEWGRGHIAEDIWVRAAMRLTTGVVERGGRVVIDDMRFENEYEAIKSAGGECWHISRPGLTPVGSHASEGALDHIEFPVTLTNDGTIEDLQDHVDALLELRW